MANPQAEQALMTPPQPSRIKQRLPEASPFTAFLKHLPDLTPPRATTYNSYSSFAFTVQSPAPPRLASHQTPAKSRSGDQDQEAAPFANILALADLKATPVKTSADEQDGISYRGNETPYGLRSPIPLFLQSPRRPGPSGGSPTPGTSKLGPAPGSEVRESLRPPSSLGVSLGSPNLITSAFAALLEGHSRSSPGGALNVLSGGGRGAGAGAGPSVRSFSGLFSPAKAPRPGSSQGGAAAAGGATGGGSGGGTEDSSQGAGADRAGADVAAGVVAGGATSGCGGEATSGGAAKGAGAGAEPLGAAADDSQPDSREVDGGQRGATSGGMSSAAAARSAMPPPPPPFFSSPPLVGGMALPSGAGLSGGPAGSSGLERGGSLQKGSERGAEDGVDADSGSESEDDRDDGDAENDEDYANAGERLRHALARRHGGHSRRSMPAAESPRMVRRRPAPGSGGEPALSYGTAGGVGMFNGAPGAPRRGRMLGSADSLVQGYATDDDAEPTPLLTGHAAPLYGMPQVHAMLPQSPMCVPLNLDTFLPIPKLRSNDKLLAVAGVDGGSPTHRACITRPASIDSPAVKMAANAAITAALEAAVGPASSSGASGSAARSARGAAAGEGGRGSALAARAAAAAAAAGGGAPLTRRMSSNSSARAPSSSFLPTATSDEALMARMLAQSNKKCNCKKSKCLKLYCDCFAGGGFCGPQCSCVGCSNRADNMDVVKGAREQIASRNPNAFKEKIEADPSLGGQHRRGCNCKKSHCMKKYCECFSAGVPCGEHCKCEGCHNTPDSHRRQPPGRGRRGAAQPPLPPAAAVAMRAGAFPILIPTGPNGRGMAMPAAAAQTRAGAAAPGAHGVATDAAAALALGGALQFLLPLAQQQQQQQSLAAAGGPAGVEDHSAATPRALAGSSDAAADAAAGRQHTPSPSLPLGGPGGASTPAGAAAGAASPQMLQIFSMLQASPAGGTGAKQQGAGGAQGVVTSNGQIFVPLMWPFGSGGGGLPFSLPAEAQGDPTAALKFLQQFAAQQTQQAGAQATPAPLVAQQQQQQGGPPSGAPSAPSTAAVPQQQQAQQGTPPALPPFGEAAMGASTPTVLPVALPASPLVPVLAAAAAAGPSAAAAHASPQSTAMGDSQGAATTPTEGSGTPSAPHHSPSFSFMPANGAQAWAGQQASSPASIPGAALLGASGVQAAAQQAQAAHARASPAAVSDMDLVLDSPRGVDGPSAAAAALAAAAAPAGEGGALSWLQLNAVGHGAASQRPRQEGAAGSGAVAASGMAPEEADEHPQQAQQEGPTTRKRSRGADRPAAELERAGSGGQQAPPLSPRATPTKRKPLRTITSALM